MPRTVFCQYEKKEAEGLDYVPYPGELGQQISARPAGPPGWRTRPC